MILYDTGGGGIWRGAKLYPIILERPLSKGSVSVSVKNYTAYLNVILQIIKCGGSMLRYFMFVFSFYL